MKVPLSWLKEYVEFDASADELAEKLTFSGIEVEGIERVGGEYPGIVVAEVLSISPHPQADRLVLCRVHDGTEELPIVCGAKNFAVGDKVPLARVGTRLPDGTKIKKAKIRGETSMGMMCAEDELGISADHEGIMILSRDIHAGTDFASVMGAPDVVLDLEITWNRPDCLSILGIAREVAALYHTGLKLPEIDLPEEGGEVSGQARVDVRDPDLCPRYIARVLSGIQLGESPDWMRRRLMLCGFRPINNVVDITNYVMLECGQPLHAFDRALLSGGEIVVRRAYANETMTVLDGTECRLSDDILVIADADKPVALAGVMGGVGSEIREDTATVLLESACFEPAAIQSASSRLGIASESSHRFERGVDIMGVQWAGRRAAALMVRHAGAVCCRGEIDVFPVKPEERVVHCRCSRVRKLLGVDIEKETIVSLLTSLQLPVQDLDEDTVAVRVPTFRPDLSVEADLVEEIARLYGLDKIPEPTPHSVVVPGARDDATRHMTACREHLVGLGLTEILNYSFVSSELLDSVTRDASRRVVLPNPVSAEYAVLRDSLIPQMLVCLGRNLARQVGKVALFEIGRVFAKDGKDGIKEEDRVAIGLMGRPAGEASITTAPVDAQEVFLWMKGIVEQAARAHHLSPTGEVPTVTPGGALEFSSADHPAFEPGQAVTIRIDGEPCGYMGVVSANIRNRWRMLEPTAVAEISLAPLLRHVSDPPALRPLPVFPAVHRDVAIVVEEALTHEQVTKVMRDNAPPELTTIELFDIFRSEDIGRAKKSLAYSLTYRSLERTLTDEDANRYHEAVKGALKSVLNAKIRES